MVLGVLDYKARKKQETPIKKTDRLHFWGGGRLRAIWVGFGWLWGPSKAVEILYEQLHSCGNPEVG